MMRIDARVPVVFGGLADVEADDAVLLEGERLPPPWAGVAFQPLLSEKQQPGHPDGCACCTPRAVLALQIGELFVARAKGDVPFFRRVVAVPVTDAGRAALLLALTEDPVCMARFRIA